MYGDCYTRRQGPDSSVCLNVGVSTCEKSRQDREREGRGGGGRERSARERGERKGRKRRERERVRARERERALPFIHIVVHQGSTFMQVANMYHIHQVLHSNFTVYIHRNIALT